MNENFQAVEDFINTTGVPKLQDGAISSTAKIADGVVSVVKLDAKPVCLLDKSGTQAITGTLAQVTGFATTLNVQGDHDNAANAITIQTAGLYRVTCSMRTDENTSKAVAVAAYINGAEAFRQSTSAESSVAVAGGSKVLSLAANDVVTMYGLAADGSANVQAASTFLSVEYVGAAS